MNFKFSGRPSMAAIDIPTGPSMAAKFAMDGPAGPVVGDHRWSDSSLIAFNMVQP